MAESSDDLIRRYLEDAIAAEKSFETQLREFAAEGDDDEVQSAFAFHADQTRRQYERLAARLEQIGGALSNGKNSIAQLFARASQVVQSGRVPEERTAHNLISAFSIENGECAMYEALACLANAVGDAETEMLAREIQTEERNTAEKLARFIPSRSKIAFNMLTVSEVDPAVETRAPDDRIV
ncbi:MAG: DUF892 family protein [Bryobacteraceae bacterium]